MLERCGGVPAFQYETVRGDAPVTRLTASFDNLYFRNNPRTSDDATGTLEADARAATIALDLFTSRPAMRLFAPVFFRNFI